MKYKPGFSKPRYKQEEEARRQRAVRSNELLSFVWQLSKPTMPGMWWYRHGGKHIDICRVRQIDIDCYDNIERKALVEWAGPIPEPKEI